MPKTSKYPANGESQGVRKDPKTGEMRPVILTFKNGKCVGKKWAAKKKAGRTAKVKTVPIAGPPAN